MRTIKKIASGNYNLSVAQQNHGTPTTDEEANNAWRGFTDHGNTLCHKLLVEQFGLCCYTELNLADLKRIHNIGAHFEHEQPKSLYPQRTFDELNLLRCALESQDLQRYNGNNRFGGHHKLNTYDPRFFISPQSLDCRRYFVYLPDGTINPMAGLSDIENAQAEYTIKTLNLNAPFLKAERERWLSEIKPEIDRLLDVGNLPALENLAECELTLTNRSHPDLMQGPFPQLRHFHSATRLMFGKVGQKIIQNHCPQID